MSLQVFLQVALRWKSLNALQTLKWSFTTVFASVNHKVGLSLIWSWAPGPVATVSCFIQMVRLVMISRCARSLKHTFTGRNNTAVVHLIFGMHIGMLFKVRFQFKPSTTVSTFKGTNVNLQLLAREQTYVWLEVNCQIGHAWWLLLATPSGVKKGTDFDASFGYLWKLMIGITYDIMG